MTALLRPTPAARATNAKVRPPLRSLDRPTRRAAPAPRDRRLLAVVAGGLLFTAVLAGNVSVHAQATQGQFELERLEKLAGERQARYQQLRLEVAELEAPDRIVARARRMGMVEPRHVTYLAPTAATSATSEPAAAAARPRVATGEAARTWAEVKPHLDRQR